MVIVGLWRRQPLGRVAVWGLVFVALIVALPRAGCAGGLRGYHGATAVWGKSGAAVAWLNRRSQKSEVLMFARTGPDAKVRGRPMVISRHALGSVQPRLAYVNRRYIVVYSHRGEEQPGLYAQVQAEHKGGGTTRRIHADASRLCRSMPAGGGSLALGVVQGQTMIEILSLQPDTLNTRSLVTIDAGTAVDSCDIVRHGDRWGVVWAVGGGLIEAAWLDDRGRVLQRRKLKARGTSLSAYALKGGGLSLWVVPGPGVGTVGLELDAQLREQRQVELSHDGKYFSLVAAAPFSQPLVTWLEKSHRDSNVLTAYLGVVGRHGFVEVKRLSKTGAARREVHAWGTGQRAAITYSDSEDGGRVGWWLFQAKGAADRGPTMVSGAVNADAPKSASET